MKKVRFGYLAYQTSFDCPKTCLSIVKCPQGGGILAKTFFIDNLPFMCIIPNTHYLIMNKKLNALFSETPCIYDFKVIKQHKQ